jgi:Fe-S-cluster-containing hydrogenase component 2
MAGKGNPSCDQLTFCSGKQNDNTNLNNRQDFENGGYRVKKFAPLLIWLVFAAIAVTLWLVLGSLFHLVNFLYIGTAASIGVALFTRGNKYARIVTQLAVGLYMLIFLGIIRRENMQIEGFWFYLFNGLFQAALIHFIIAKVAGPLLFGRGWCGYACWTAMVLDFLPWKVPAHPRASHIGLLRYAMLALSLAFSLIVVMLYDKGTERIMWYAFIAGNALYYISGIVLAIIFQDNRAFCKYLCPVAAILKPVSYFSLIRIKVSKAKCVGCGKCERVCPMNVKMLDPNRSRENGTECILCFECARVCPKKAIQWTTELNVHSPAGAIQPSGRIISAPTRRDSTPAPVRAVLPKPPLNVRPGSERLSQKESKLNAQPDRPHV